MREGAVLIQGDGGRWVVLDIVEESLGGETLFFAARVVPWTKSRRPTEPGGPVQSLRGLLEVSAMPVLEREDVMEALQRFASLGRIPRQGAWGALEAAPQRAKGLLPGLSADRAGGAWTDPEVGSRPPTQRPAVTITLLCQALEEEAGRLRGRDGATVLCAPQSAAVATAQRNVPGPAHRSEDLYAEPVLGPDAAGFRNLTLLGWMLVPGAAGIRGEPAPGGRNQRASY